MKNQNISRTQVEAILSSFNRDEIRAFAKNWEVARGKNKSDTLRNCVDAIMDNKARVCMTIMVKPNHACANEIGESFAVKKVYSYKPARDVKKVDGTLVEYAYNRV
jgi:hypothetical protein